MSTWLSWAKAAPGVMVEVVDAVEGKRTPWHAAVGRAWAWNDEPGRRDAAPAAGSPAVAPRTDAQRRRLS